MESSKKKKPPKIRIPAVYVWAAGQIAKAQGMHADLLKIQAIFRSSLISIQNAHHWQDRHAVNFSREVKKSLNQGVIPFIRDDLDVAFATFVFGDGAEFLLRSEKSRVECGFLRASHKEIKYVDSANDMIRADSKYGELLSESDKVDILLTLQSLALEPAFYQSATEDESLLKVSGKQGAFSAVQGKITCNISLWNGPQPGQSGTMMGSLNRNLGRAKLELHGHALYLEELSAQDKLELTAASVMGQWLLIESEGFKAFGALPDLTVDDDQRKVAVDPMPLLKKFTLGVAPNVYAEQDDARYFSKMYPWFVPEDSKTWMESISL
jgi:hypothetical protein